MTPNYKIDVGPESFSYIQLAPIAGITVNLSELKVVESPTIHPLEEVRTRYFLDGWKRRFLLIDEMKKQDKKTE